MAALLKKVAGSMKDELFGTKKRGSTDPEPSCACADAEQIIGFGGKLQLNYKELNISTMDDGSVLLQDRMAGKYYIAKDGVTTGPFSAGDRRLAGFDKIDETGNDMEALLLRFKDYISKSGEKYLITFGGKTYKVVVASGMTCPTRDGALGKGGCAFCDLRGSSSYFGKQGRSSTVKEQIESRIPAIRERFKATHFLAYFQSYTNTYSDVLTLRQLYESALLVPDIHGLCIGTRPDCLPDSVIDLLEELAQRTYVSLELGIQSFEDQTLESAHSFPTSSEEFPHGI